MKEIYVMFYLKKDIQLQKKIFEGVTYPYEVLPKD